MTNSFTNPPKFSQAMHKLPQNSPSISNSPLPKRITNKTGHPLAAMEKCLFNLILSDENHLYLA